MKFTVQYRLDGVIEVEAKDMEEATQKAVGYGVLYLVSSGPYRPDKTIVSVKEAEQ